MGYFSSGWVWNGEWTINLKSNECLDLPAHVLMDGNVWEIKVQGAPPVCWKCGSPDHMAGSGVAKETEEPVFTKREKDWAMLWSSSFQQ